MKKLFIAVLIGLLIFTACDEDTDKVDNEAEIITPLPSLDNAVYITGINVTSIKIRNVSINEETILIKDGIVREFLSFFSSLEYKKIDNTPQILFETEIFDTGDSVLKISFGDYSVSFSENVKIGNTVLEKGCYEVDKSLSLNLQHFFEGSVINPQHIEVSSNIIMPESMNVIDEYTLDMIDKGSSKINSPEIFMNLYIFAERNVLGQKFEIVEAENINSYELMEQYKRNAMKNNRVLIFDTPVSYIIVDSDLGYNQSIIATNSFLVAENIEKPGFYKLYTDSMIIDFKVNDRFITEFEDIFLTNTKELTNLTIEEIEALINDTTPHCMEYISKNLNIEKWMGIQPENVKKQKMILNDHEGPYTVLEIYDEHNLRLLFFKEDKFIDYIDYGYRFAGTEYRLEKAGDKVFIVGRRCREHGTGIERNYEEWYLLSESGKKLVMGFPCSYFYQQDIWGYEMTADKVQFNAGGDMNVTVDYNIRKFYGVLIDISNDPGIIEVEGTKKVLFKWDEEKDVFISEYGQNGIGMFEITPESDDIRAKCTEFLKSKYYRFVEFISLYNDEDEFSVKYISELLRDFLNSCNDCDEKSKLLELIDDINK